jgi:hypothetical protein
VLHVNVNVTCKSNILKDESIGPRKVIFNSNTLLINRWFGGFLTRSEAEGLLHNCPEGTFLVRFSKYLYSRINSNAVT